MASIIVRIFFIIPFILNLYISLGFSNLISTSLCYPSSFNQLHGSTQKEYVNYVACANEPCKHLHCYVVYTPTQTFCQDHALFFLYNNISFHVSNYLPIYNQVTMIQVPTFNTGYEDCIYIQSIVYPTATTKQNCGYIDVKCRCGTYKESNLQYKNTTFNNITKQDYNDLNDIDDNYMKEL